MAPRGANLAPRGDISAPNGAKIWRLRTTANLALNWRQVGVYLGKRVTTLSDRFLAPNFDFLAPKSVFGASHRRQNKILAPKSHLAPLLLAPKPFLAPRFSGGLL